MQQPRWPPLYTQDARHRASQQRQPRERDYDAELALKGAELRIQEERKAG